MPEWNGQEMSIEALADYLGVEYAVVWKYLRRGYSCDSDIGRPYASPKRLTMTPEERKEANRKRASEQYRKKKSLKFQEGIQVVGEAKRVRTYEGEQLERRRAYQREYNRKKREAEKAANPKAATKAGKPITLTRKPQEASRPIFIEAKPEANSYSLQEYQAAIEADRERFAHDWNDSAKSFFESLQSAAKTAQESEE